MGSFFAGVKAGTLSGILYMGGLAIFSVVLLYLLKPEVLAAIGQSNPASCTATGAGNTTSVDDCFNLVVSVYVPFNAFVGFFIALIFAGIFGVAYDSIPVGNWVLKGEVIATVVGVALIWFGLSGFSFNYESEVITSAFFIAWSGVFGYMMGRLYRKYTRLVGFESSDPGLLTIVVDGRNVTGSTRTFALTSSHKLRADVAEDGSFKEWKSSGGVVLEDQRSFETVFEVTGPGTLKGQVTKKY